MFRLFDVRVLSHGHLVWIEACLSRTVSKNIATEISLMYFCTIRCMKNGVYMKGRNNCNNAKRVSYFVFFPSMKVKTIPLTA